MAVLLLRWWFTVDLYRLIKFDNSILKKLFLITCTWFRSFDAYNSKNVPLDIYIFELSYNGCFYLDFGNFLIVSVNTFDIGFSIQTSAKEIFSLVEVQYGIH